MKIIIARDDDLHRYDISERKLSIYRGLAYTGSCVAIALVLGAAFQTGRSHLLSGKIDRYQQHIELQQTAIDILNKENQRHQRDVWELARVLGAIQDSADDAIVDDELPETLHALALSHEQVAENIRELTGVFYHAMPPPVSTVAMHSDLAGLDRSVQEIGRHKQQIETWIRRYASESSGQEIIPGLEQASEAMSGLLAEMQAGARQAHGHLYGARSAVPCSIDHDGAINVAVTHYIDSLSEMTTAGRHIGIIADYTLGELEWGEETPLAQIDAELSERLDDYHEASDRLREILTDYVSLPTGSPMRSEEINSSFGMRNDPFTGRQRHHGGVDFAAPAGTPVVTQSQGTVVHAGARGSYGILVEVEHAEGVTTRYAHLSKASVQVGDEVRPGDTLGLVGSTGRSTGDHLHYEVLLNNERVDPVTFIEAHMGMTSCGPLFSAQNDMRGEENVIVQEEG